MGFANLLHIIFPLHNLEKKIQEVFILNGSMNLEDWVVVFVVSCLERKMQDTKLLLLMAGMVITGKTS